MSSCSSPRRSCPWRRSIYASGIIHDELEEQTFTYLLIRPIPKWAIYLVKLLATATVAVILTAIFTALAYAAIYLGADSNDHNILLRCVTACCIHSLAVIAYCCLFGLISLFTARILIVGIIYIAVVEGLFANLDFGIRLLTVIYYTRLIAYHAMPFLVPTPYGTQDFAAETWQLDIANDPKLLLHPQVITCLIVLLAGSRNMRGDRRFPLLATRIPHENAREDLRASGKIVRGVRGFQHCLNHGFAQNLNSDD